MCTRGTGKHARMDWASVSMANVLHWNTSVQWFGERIRAPPNQSATNSSMHRAPFVATVASIQTGTTSNVVKSKWTFTLPANTYIHTLNHIWYNPIVRTCNHINLAKLLKYMDFCLIAMLEHTKKKSLTNIACHSRLCDVIDADSICKH